MAINDKFREDQDFSFGVRELRQAAAAETLSLRTDPPKPVKASAVGFDPYNTSGSFDRKKNWARVGRR